MMSSTVDDDVAAAVEVAAVAHMEMVLPVPLGEDIAAAVALGNTVVYFAASVRMAHTFCFHVQVMQLRQAS